MKVVRGRDARRILDLGCGTGDFLLRLAKDSTVDRIVGIDLCGSSLRMVRQRLSTDRHASSRVELLRASIEECGPLFPSYDCAVLVETIEHVDQARLMRLENAVFAEMQPTTVVVTTPNAEFNALLGVPSHRFRHPDHKFEWDRPRFRRWAAKTASRHGYDVSVDTIAGSHPVLGGASQMAVFDVAGEEARAG